MIRQFQKRIALLIVVGFATTIFNHVKAETELPSLHIDINQSSVSGLSSGAYLAVQFHVAFSATMVGAGIIAGGPYYCTQGIFFPSRSKSTDA